MDSFVITWRELLIVVAVVLAVYVAEMLLLLRSNRGFRRWKPDATSLQPKIEALESEIDMLREQVLMLKEQIDQVQSTQQQGQFVSASPSTPYSQAIQMAQQGMDVDEVAASCGISRGEAELIVAMHRARSS